MRDETALITILAGLVDELRDVAKELARAGNGLPGGPREQLREIQHRIEAMRRHYEHLASVLENARGEDSGPGPMLKPAAGGEPR